MTRRKSDDRLWRSPGGHGKRRIHITNSNLYVTSGLKLYVNCHATIPSFTSKGLKGHVSVLDFVFKIFFELVSQFSSSEAEDVFKSCDRLFSQRFSKPRPEFPPKINIKLIEPRAKSEHTSLNRNQTPNSTNSPMPTPSSLLEG